MIYILGWNKRSWREAWDLEGEAGPGQGEDEGLREGRPSKRAGLTVDHLILWQCAKVEGRTAANGNFPL